MAAYEVLLLNTAIPQIQAAQSGDTYLVPRDIAINATAIISANSATDALRITQTGAGNAILVEDSANPDSTPFVVTATGDVGIGTSSPTAPLDVVSNSSAVGISLRGRSADNIGTLCFYTNNGVTNDAQVQMRPSDNEFRILVSGSRFQSFYTNGSERMRLDSSGNLGLGVTPSAWGGSYRVAQIGGSIATLNLDGTANSGAVAVNAYNNGTNWLYTRNGPATRLDYNLTAGGAWVWNIAGSGTANSASVTSGASYTVVALGTTTLGEWQTLFSGLGSLPSLGQVITATATGSILNGGLVTQNISFTQAMTLDASGNLGVGTSSPNYLIHSQTTSTNITTNLKVNAGAAANNYAEIAFQLWSGAGTGLNTFGGSGDSRPSVVLRALSEDSSAKGAFVVATFSGGTTNATLTEKARITSDGNFLVGTQSQINTTITSIKGTSGTNVLGLQNSNDNNYLITALNSSGTEVFRIAGTGNALNANGSYGTISDAKMKTDIVDAGSQWSDIKALRFRKFKMKNDPSGLVQLGVVAQEVELTSPGLVDEHADKDAEGNDLGTTTKSVKTSVLLMKAAVALQEAMARIEKLEAEVAALKGA